MTLEGVLHLCPQAGGVVSNPLAQGFLRNAVITDDGITPGMRSHPELWETDRWMDL